MTSKPWHLLASAVLLLSIASFWWIFQEGKSDPELGSIPYVFWTSFAITLLIVVATFIGSRIFPHEEDSKS
ncbi:MAG: hypothetical protein MUE75_13320 [Algoriphagus sp.]|nr:hypothetical protein [Algoriphagus sp.]